ncbi:MAG: lipopolysaccharide biosynthesis protein [Ginsengibacter sp.]
MSLKNKAVSGAFWTFIQQFSVQFINFAVQIILARLLLPREFGLIAMIAVFIAIGNKLTDGGMTSSLIRTTNPDHEDYSTVFYMNILVSIVTYIIIFLFAPFIARFFEHSILRPLIRVFSLSIIIRAFVGVQTTILTKEMKFKVQMRMQIPSIIVGGIVGIAMAYAGYGVWSLVYMNLISSVLFTVQHWFYSPWRPSFIINKKKLKYHFDFGYKLTLSGLLNALFDNIYNIIIGKFFTPVLLGLYNRAYTLQLFPSQNISTALEKVTYPVFAAIQNNDKKLKTVYRLLMQQVVFWIAPLMIFSAILAKPLFSLVLTDKWLPAVRYFQILGVVGVLYPLQQYNLNILRVKGRSDLILKLNLYKKLTLFAGIAVAITYGVMGLVILQAVGAIIGYFYNSHYSGKFIDYSTTDQVKDILPLLILALICGSVVYFSYQTLYYDWYDSYQLLLGFASGFILYIGLAFLFKVNALSVFKDLIVGKLKGKLKKGFLK